MTGKKRHTKALISIVVCQATTFFVKCCTIIKKKEMNERSQQYERVIQFRTQNIAGIYFSE